MDERSYSSRKKKKKQLLSHPRRVKKNQKLLFKFPQQPEQSLVNERGASMKHNIPRLFVFRISWVKEEIKKKPIIIRARHRRARLSPNACPLYWCRALSARPRFQVPFFPKPTRTDWGGGVLGRQESNAPPGLHPPFFCSEREKTRETLCCVQRRLIDFVSWLPPVS